MYHGGKLRGQHAGLGEHLAGLGEHIARLGEHIGRRNDKSAAQVERCPR
jgi:hypothetical protein